MGASLADPDPATLERVARLLQRIRAAIARAGGVLAFDRYMALCLYEPELGYYTGPQAIFGASGDFVTAPESGALFAACLARQCAELLAAGDVIVEYGAGSGRLAAALLASPCAPARYVIVEPSARLSARQRALIAQEVPAALPRVEWWREHAPAGLRGVVLANEVLDAMPVKRFVVQGGVPRELGVACDGERLVMREFGGSAAIWPAALARACVDLPDGYVSEFNPALPAWTRAVRGALSAGVVLISDYGYPRHEYLHPSRLAGTLKCHYRHHVHDDPLFLPGAQDITAAVDFTALAEAAEAAGFTLAGYATQANFLLACGIEADLAGAHDPVHGYRLAQEAKRLLLPGEMGQICKFMALGCEREVAALRGFEHDERHRLSGFSR